jgi:hypothetical protein
LCSTTSFLSGLPHFVIFCIKFFMIIPYNPQNVSEPSLAGYICSENETRFQFRIKRGIFCFTTTSHIQNFGETSWIKFVWLEFPLYLNSLKLEAFTNNTWNVSLYLTEHISQTLSGQCCLLQDWYKRYSLNTL